MDIKEIIKATIIGEEHLGENLKKQCIEYIDNIHTRIDKAIKILSEGVTFCENDSQGVYDKCNIAIHREKAAIKKLKGELHG